MAVKIKSSSIFSLLLLLVYSTQATFLSPCGPDSPCDSNKFLTCISNQCQCQDAETQTYDVLLDQCAAIVGEKCASSKYSDSRNDAAQLGTENPPCVSNSECSDLTNTCKCYPGFVVNSLKTCSSGFGSPCVFDKDCELDKGLLCSLDAEICKCANSSDVYHEKLGCVNPSEGNLLAKLIALSKGEDNNVVVEEMVEEEGVTTETAPIADRNQFPQGGNSPNFQQPLLGSGQGEIPSILGTLLGLNNQQVRA